MTSRLKSIPLTEFVMAPIDIQSAVVFAYLLIFLIFIPPEISIFIFLRIPSLVNS